MASVVSIANRALQINGATRIVSLADNSKSARAINTAYDPLRQKELRNHTWSFAVKRVSLAASATPPVFGRANAYPLPSDYLRILPPDPEATVLGYGEGAPLIFASGGRPDRDWQIEKNADGLLSIITNQSAPLLLRYVADVTDPNQMDALFREALSALLAEGTCEELTQSNEKKAYARTIYKDTIAEAKMVNAIERVPSPPVLDPWLAARL